MKLQEALRARQAPSPPPAPRPRRADLGVFVAVLLGPALFLAASAALRQRVGDLEERLVRDAGTALEAPRLRPVHVDRPRPGSLGDALAPHLPPIEAEARAGGDDQGTADKDQLRAVVAGDAPLAALPSRFAVALGRLRPDLDAVLEGTHAERADLGESAEASMPAKGATWEGYQLAALLAGVEVRRALAGGDATRAAAVCLDALALGRDAALTGGLVGRMVQVAITSRLAPACAAALEDLPPAEARRALGRLRIVRDALPPFSTTLREEHVTAQLIIYGPLLPERARARLGPRSLAIVATGERAQRPWQRLVTRDSWRATRRVMDDLVAVADLEPEAFDAAEKRVMKGARKRLNPLTSIAMPTYAKYARRAEVSLRRMDAIALAVGAAVWRAERGAWPRSPGVLASAGLVTPEEAHRTATARLEPAAGGRALEVSLPLPQGDREKDPASVTLRVEAR